MIETNRDRRHFYTRINLLLDVIATSVIYYISVAVWLGIIKQDSENIATQPLLGILFICIKFVCLTLMGLYDSHGHRRLRRQFLIVFRSLLLDTAHKLLIGEETQIDTDVGNPLYTIDNVAELREIHVKAGALQ